MSDCCSPSPASSTDSTDSPCPRCGRSGRSVDRLTLKALLRPPALERLGPGEYRFCANAECAVVYFSEAQLFGRDDVTVPVFQKEAHGRRTVCYCFDIGEADLRREAETGARGSAVARITQHVKEGRCACELRNPQGSCCLGNISLVTSALQTESLEDAGNVR
jgi:hypothetical protein